MTTLTYERALVGLIEDDPEDDLRFHHLLDAPREKAEEGAALVAAIRHACLRDRVRGIVTPDDDQLASETDQILCWRDQIVERWRAADRSEELRTMRYAEYLRTPEWRARRLTALDRAGHRCEVCNTPSSLDVHHRTYERRGQEQDSDLTVLCRSCHGLFHEHRDLSH